MSNTVLSQVRAKAREVWVEHDLLNEGVEVRARTLTVEEAIGNPEGDDFPLQKGKERLIEAVFRGARGQAFTDMYGDYSGTLGDVAELDLVNNYRRAVFIAVLNAVMSKLGLCGGAIHCRDKQPSECAVKLRSCIAKRFGSPKVTQVGFQPKMVEQLGQGFTLRVLDLDPNNIGQTKQGALIEGPKATDDAVAWADVLVVTGSALANDTLDRFLCDKPTLLFGSTIAGAAPLMGWERFCMMDQ